MLCMNLLFLSGLAATVIGEPIPQSDDNPFSALGDDLFGDMDDPFADLGDLGDLGSLLPTGLTLPTGNPFSDMPMLPSSIQSVLMTAAPTNAIEDPCTMTAIPDWYKKLPADVKSGLSSYEIALQSWYEAHPGIFGSATVTDPGVAGICTTSAGAPPKNTGGSDSTPTTEAGGSGSTNTPNAGGNDPTPTQDDGGSESTPTEDAISSSSTNAAPRPTGALAASLAGAVGMFGVMIAL